MNTKTLESFLETYMETSKFSDCAVNGLQVEGNRNIRSIALGVSASLGLFRKAVQEKADTIIVHHGLFWGKTSPALKGVLGERTGFLFRNNLNLFAYHLPLDWHPDIGNNALIAGSLKLGERITFARHGGMDIGVMGRLPQPLSAETVVKKLKAVFGQVNQSYLFGKKTIRNAAIVSGGASGDVYEAYERGADIFITGETGEPVQEWCREAGMNYLACGHYATEQSGIKKLGEIISGKFNIPSVFIDVPNKV